MRGIVTEIARPMGIGKLFHAVRIIFLDRAVAIPFRDCGAEQQRHVNPEGK